MSNLESTLRTPILSYLSKGISAAQTARALNCSEAYISQLLATDEFKQELASLQQSDVMAGATHDEQMDRIEKTLLDKVEFGLQMQPLMKATDAIAMWSKLNAGRRRHAVPLATVAAASAQNTTIVNLQLPPALMGKFTLNAKNQVIEAGNQSLVTMHSGELDKLVGRTPGKKEVVPTLPAPEEGENYDSPTIQITQIDEYGFAHATK